MIAMLRGIWPVSKLVLAKSNNPTTCTDKRRQLQPSCTRVETVVSSLGFGTPVQPANRLTWNVPCAEVKVYTACASPSLMSTTKPCSAPIVLFDSVSVTTRSYLRFAAASGAGELRWVTWLGGLDQIRKRRDTHGYTSPAVLLLIKLLVSSAVAGQAVGFSHRWLQETRVREGMVHWLVITAHLGLRTRWLQSFVCGESLCRSRAQH